MPIYIVFKPKTPTVHDIALARDGFVEMFPASTMDSVIGINEDNDNIVQANLMLRQGFFD